MSINLDNIEEQQEERVSGGIVKADNEVDNIENQLLSTLNVIQSYKTKIAKLQKSLAEQKAKDTKNQYQEFKETEQEYQELKQRLLDFPDMIKEQKENILVLEEYAEDAKQEVQVLEDMQMQIIQDEVDGNDKKKYSNQAARDAAMNIWKKDDTNYQAAKKALKSAQNDLENAKFDLDRIYNDYKSAQKIADMLTARMNMFVG